MRATMGLSRLPAQAVTKDALSRVSLSVISYLLLMAMVMIIPQASSTRIFQTLTTLLRTSSQIPGPQLHSLKRLCLEDVPKMTLQRTLHVHGSLFLARCPGSPQSL